MPNPTFEEIRSNPAYYGIPEATLRQKYDAKFGQTAAPEATPGIWDRIKSIATSKPAMMTAAALLAAPLTGGMSIPATMAVEGGVGALSGLASNIINGKQEGVGEMATDAALGAAGPVAGRALSATGRGLAYVGESLPRSIRGLIGFGGLATGHPGALALEAATNPKLLPKALTKVGDAYTAGVDKLRGLAGNPLVEDAAEVAMPKPMPINARGRGLTREIPYRAGGSISTPPVEPQLGRDVVQRAEQQIAGPFRQDPTNVINDVIQSGPTMDRMYAESKAGTEFADKFGMGAAKERWNVGKGNFRGVSVEPVDFAPPLAVGSKNIGMSEVDAFLNRAGLGNVGKRATAAAPVAEAPVAASAARPAADYVHPADTSGAKFGFDSLPELSESELTRLQALFHRVAAR